MAKGIKMYLIGEQGSGKTLLAQELKAVLVRYGAARSIVRLEPDDRDRSFIDTDAAMRATRDE